MGRGKEQERKKHREGETDLMTDSFSEKKMRHSFQRCLAKLYPLKDPTCFICARSLLRASYHFVSHVINRASAYVDEHRIIAYNINGAFLRLPKQALGLFSVFPFAITFTNHTNFEIA